MFIGFNLFFGGAHIDSNLVEFHTCSFGHFSVIAMLLLPKAVPETYTSELFGCQNLLQFASKIEGFLVFQYFIPVIFRVFKYKILFLISRNLIQWHNFYLNFWLLFLHIFWHMYNLIIFCKSFLRCPHPIVSICLKLSLSWMVYIIFIYSLFKSYVAIW